MKFEDFLMERSEKENKKLELQEEVDNLQAELDEEKEVNRVLRRALQGPMLSQRLVSSLLPPQVQALLAELAMVEEEILWLERKIDELKMKLYQEKKETKEWKMRQLQQLRQQDQLTCDPGNDDDLKQRTRSQNYEVFRKGTIKSRRKGSMGSALDILSLSPQNALVCSPCIHCYNLKIFKIYRLSLWFWVFQAGEFHEGSKKHTWRIQNHCPVSKENIYEKPNALSEELVKCLIGIFLELNQPSQDKEGSAIVPKLSFSCMASKGYIAKPSFNFKSPLFPLNQNTSNIDPYGILPELEGIIRDVGPYKNFIQITRRSLDVSRFSECLEAIGKLRVLMHKLSNIDVTFLTYKQKLAFWINIYNACIMHAFLEHGLPSTQEKLLALMNKAALNVGGIVLNALAIEHFILRHPCESKYGPMDEKEMLLRHAYGLGYPEPNVTFALCRGSWSSPALRIYTADEVVDELGRARVEYLEASVGVTDKRKILVPKLLQWHMRDFADDMESLLEWIYSQLPSSASLKRLIMECLNKETKSLMTKMVEVQHYESEFRYLLPL
ncbi:LOW QUALITY PROTEIN: uncharacterized protein LOC111310201 [Durio zibethinus]|uniref:LOW QUALITY PROTEIN: uncharacterized protein LOC111310201 n=1 Tax=Durio zibethinus TaxID=66656 RepID=A0A6P6AJW2_DURZI|nr:LOW QUALITY PROTEIN: uncharacterized protein LOC111310201 [Durio zibethinus]